MKKLLLVILLLGLLIGAFYYSNNKAQEQEELDKIDFPGTEEGLKFYNLFPGMAISSPITIIGEIPGTWYFEGSFPATLTNEAGDILTISVAQAQNDWMTEKPVIFALPMHFDTLGATSGYLILKKDNPSGLEGYDQSISWPVNFK